MHLEVWNGNERPSQVSGQGVGSEEGAERFQVVKDFTGPGLSNLLDRRGDFVELMDNFVNAKCKTNLPKLSAIDLHGPCRRTSLAP